MPVPRSDSPPSRSLLRESAYVRIRDAIVDGTLEPGERLRDQDLEAWLGVSRTPIREALLELQRAGLVVARPGRSTVVAPVDVATTRDAQQVASALHALAARLAVARLTDADLAAMEAANRRFEAALGEDDVDAALAADDDFHAVLVAASGNRVLGHLLEQVIPLLRRVERLRFSSLAGRTSVQQHQLILGQCRAGDAEAAAAASAANWHTLDSHLTPDHNAGKQENHGHQ